MKLFTLKKKNTGYAILFAIVIVSIISMISVGLANTSYKQLVLSSLASDSQMAYFKSDTATECALYADSVLNILLSTHSGQAFTCAGETLTITEHTASDYGDGYDAVMTGIFSGTGSVPCFEFSVNKADPAATVIYARGYNICDKANPKTVERTIEIVY